MAKKAVRVRLPLWNKLIYSAALLLFVLLCLEVLMRCCGWGPGPAVLIPGHPTGGRKGSPVAYFAVCDPHLGIRNRPNGSFRTRYVEGEPLVTTDEFGYRNGYGWPGDGQSPIVLFVGDSFTFCAEVSDEQTGPSEVAKLLSEEFDVRVLNAGVRGYGTLQAKRMLIESLERFPDVKVAVYTFCGNDPAENLVPNLRYPLKAPFLVRDEGAGRFREVEVSGPVVPWGEGFYSGNPPRLVLSTGAKVANWLEVRSALFHRCLVGLHRIDFGTSTSVEFPDGRHAVPPSDYVEWHNWAARNGGDDAVEQLLAEMDRICRSHAAAFVATCAFNGYDVGTSRHFAANCAEAGVQFVSLEQEFTDTSSKYVCRVVDGLLDGHYGPLGTKTYARALAPALKRSLRSQLSPANSDGEAVRPN